MKKKANVNPLVALVLVIVLVVACIVALKELINPKIKYIDVSLTSAARSRMQISGMDETEFIRHSNLLGKNYLKHKGFYEDAKNRIDGMGFYILTDLKMTGRRSVTLFIDARQPMAIVSSGGKYITVDRDAHVLEIAMERTKGLILINGVVLKNPKTGQTASETTSYLSDALEIASIITENRYDGVFTEITMRENKEVFLKSNVSVPVIINLRYDVLSSLDIAKSMLDKGITEGQIVIAGDYGYSIPDDQSGTYIRGM